MAANRRATRGLGFDTLYLTTTTPQAVRFVAEHFAFCPDNIWQGNTHTLLDYATAIKDMNGWSFWWD